TPWAAKWIDCWEDPHWRSMVVAGISSGKPAASQALRPTLKVCSPTWETQPVMLSSTRPGSTPDRFTSSFSTSASRSTGWKSLSRSEEHTSELQSRGHLVCRLLLEKKNNAQRGCYAQINPHEALT